MKKLLIYGLLLSAFAGSYNNLCADTNFQREVSRAIENCIFETSKEEKLKGISIQDIASQFLIAVPTSLIHPLVSALFMTNIYLQLNEYKGRHNYIRKAYYSEGGARFSQFVENIQTIDDDISKENIIDILVTGLVEGKICNYEKEFEKIISLSPEGVEIITAEYFDVEADNSVDEMESFILRELNIEEKFHQEILDSDPTLFDEKPALLF